MAHNKIKVAILTSSMDNRPAMGTAIFNRKLVEGLLDWRNELDITLIHKEAVPNDPLYKQFNEIIIPKIPLPKYSGFFSELWFFIKCRLTGKKFDIFHFPYFRFYPTFIFAPAKKIVVMMGDAGPDLSRGHVEAGAKTNWVLDRLLGKIDGVLAMSEFGKQGLINMHKNIDPKNVYVTYGGVDLMYRPTVDKKAVQLKLEKKYGIKSPYILGSGRLDQHKNIHGLIKAFGLLNEKRGTNENLVITGGRHIPSYSDMIEGLIDKLNIRSKVTIIKVEDSDDMPLFYQGAEFLVYPSLYEGFGLPIVEAMACQIAVITSDITSCPEVAGNGALLIDPFDIESIKEAMASLLDNPELKKDLINKGIEQVKKFSWRRLAKDTVDVYKKVLFDNK